MASNGSEGMDEASLDIGLESHYDLIVVGTDLTSSIVAAGTAFSNRSVLHLDANEHYGSLDDACFTFDQAVSWAQALGGTQDENDSFDAVNGQVPADDSAVLDKVALRLYRQRAATQAQDASTTPTPNGHDKNGFETAEVKEATAVAAVDEPVDQVALAALRQRLKLVRLNQTPNRRAKLLSCGASPLARIEAEDAQVSSKNKSDVKLDVSNKSAGASLPTQPAVSEEQPIDAVAASPDLEVVPNLDEGSSAPAAEQKARLSVSDLQKQSRRWCLDLGSPRALLASGEVVDLLVASGVGRYLEFMAVTTLSVAAESAAKAPPSTTTRALPKTSAGAAAYKAASSAASSLGLWNVPCSKQDIFSSSALSMLEKNRLMKLLRCALDWGTKHVAHKADLNSQSDLDLARGRALSRPQNGQASSGGGGLSAAAGETGAAAAAAAAAAGEGTAPQAKEAPTSSNPLDPEPFVARGASFVEYLAAWKLPPRLLDAVLYGIALLPHAQTEGGSGANGNGEGSDVPSSSLSPSLEAVGAPVSTEEGLTAVFRHLTALGVHGETAFLAPLYGSGELAQAFCRLCAIHRGTYLLRHPLFGLVLEEEEEKDDGDVAAMDDAAPPHENEGASSSGNTRSSMKVAGVCDEAGFVVSCNRFVAADDYLLPSAPPSLLSASSELSAATTAAVTSTVTWWTVRRVAIVDGVVGLRVAALRPNSPGVGNSWGAIQVVTADETTYSVPADLGASILHLTTTVAISSPRASSNDTASNDATTAVLLAEAGDALAKAAHLLGQEWGNCKEVWHLSFALPLSKPPLTPSTPSLTAPVNECYLPRMGAGWPSPETQVDGGNTTTAPVRNSIVLPRDQYHFDPHSAVTTARQAFATLYPQDAPGAFLAPDEAAQQAQAEARGEVTGDLEEVELAAVLAADVKAEETRAKALTDLAARVGALEVSNDSSQRPDARLTAAEARMEELLNKLA